MRPVILWFRRNLRLADNAALQAAVESGRPVIPLYIRESAPKDITSVATQMGKLGYSEYVALKCLTNSSFDRRVSALRRCNQSAWLKY